MLLRDAQKREFNINGDDLRQSSKQCASQVGTGLRMELRKEFCYNLEQTQEKTNNEMVTHRVSW